MTSTESAPTCHFKSGRPDDSLNGKVAIVTGGSSGIGRSIGLELAAHGASVVLVARNRNALDSVASSIAAAGGKAVCVACDLALPISAEIVVREAISGFGRIDILVNCAGGSRRGSILDLSDTDWNSALSLKLLGAMRLIKASWAHLAKVHGTIINICGAAGRTPRAEHAIAATTNAGYMALTKSIAELGTKAGIRVNAINPGVVRTRRLDADLEKANVKLDDAEAVTTALNDMSQRLAMIRIGEPEDIARFVAYLASPTGGWFHGTIIDMDGGATKGL